MSDYTLFDATQIKQWLNAVFEKLGVPSKDAQMTTDALIHADLMGIDSHGLNRVTNDSYAGGLAKGKIDPKAKPEIVHQAAATAVIDGKGGLGPVAGTVAMELAIEKAKQTGAGFVAVNNSHHYGASSHYASLALPHNMIGISMTIGGLGVVATGGRGRRIGINPLSVAAPAGSQPPFILDIATSVIAAGKLELAKMKGQQVPLGWIVDAAGKPTTDPDEFWKGGAILPLGGGADTGGYKGYGLSVMIDVLAGVLSGAGFVGELRGPGGTNQTPHFQGALSIDGFLSVDNFKAIMDRMITFLKATEPAEGVPQVMVQGEREFAMEQERLKTGIPYHREVVGRLEVLADSVGVPLPQPVGTA
ncbi:MAG: Ldh family oxidoreductase [Chloroflexi bacterium]|nr:Ldh family oxidoreductase [Chloroflexota bacterium]